MIQVGLQRVIITPPIGTPLGGYAARRGFSEGIHDDLCATAFFLRDGSMPFVLLTADLVALPESLVQMVKERVWKLLQLPPENVMLAATHTHSGPDLLFGHQGLASKSYVEVLADALVGCIYGAFRDCQDASLGIGRGEVTGIARNRRNPDGRPVDPEVGVLRVDRGVNVYGILMHYTCHPVVLGPDNLLITADFPGYAVRTVETCFGGNVRAAYINGAAGDVNTGHSADLSAIGEHIPRRTFEHAERLGRLLGGEVIKVAEMIETQEHLDIAVTSRKVDLPLRAFPPVNEVEQAIFEKERALEKLIQQKAPEALVKKTKIELLYAQLLLQNINKMQCRKSDKSTESIMLQAVKIGDCALVAFPGELFVEIGLRIKERSPFKYTYIVGYANGYVGYVPTEKAFQEGGYEVISTLFTREAGDIIIDESLKLLKTLI